MNELPSKEEMEQLLDQVKIQVFLGNNAAFMGSLLCAVEVFWDTNCKTAWTNGVRLGWNPYWFMATPKKKRLGLLLHELGHTARLHMLRRGNRDPKIWNVACDLRLNNDLIRDGYEIPDGGYVDLSIDKNGILAEEDIYELLMSEAIPMPINSFGEDLQEGTEEHPVDTQKLIDSVVRATQAAEMANKAGDIPGGLKDILNKFLQPVIPWRTVLAQWMTDLLDDREFTWRRRNRRYDTMYMPGWQEPEGRLEHLAYFLDTSGSITEDDRVRFNSEVKYVQEMLRPKKLTLIQFDTIIQHVRVFTEDEPFENIEIRGGGGTSLSPVKDWIDQNEPTAAIIFSDLECAPMQPLKKEIPVLWAVIRNIHAKVPYGKIIQIID